MTTIRIMVEGVPVPYSTRTTVWRGRIGSKRPPALIDWQKRLWWAASHARLGHVIIDEAVELTIWAYMPIRGQMTKAQRALAEAEKLPCAKRPDWDNVAKAVCDALTMARVWKDDGRVSDATVRMRYSPRPRIEITVTTMVV